LHDLNPVVGSYGVYSCLKNRFVEVRWSEIEQAIEVLALCLRADSGGMIIIGIEYIAPVGGRMPVHALLRCQPSV